MNEPHALEAAKVAADLATDVRQGLTAGAARRLLETVGYNALPAERPPSFFLRLARHLSSGLTLVLLAAAVVAALLGHASDAYGILIAIAIDASFGLIQQHRADKAIAKLAKLIVAEAAVVRDGAVKKIPSAEIVPGDILVVNEGDRIAADARLIELSDLATDEAALTGESSPVQKQTKKVAAAALVPDRLNMVWMGTVAVRGEGRAIVVATGVRAEFGKIAKSLAAIKRSKTPFQTGIDRLGRRLAAASVGLAAAVLAIGWLRGFEPLEMFFFSVATVVSVIPEGLPAVLAIVLAIGVSRMAKRNAIVRHLPSVQTLGVADVICTDKTGTLTENKMTVREMYSCGLHISVTGEGWNPRGDFLVAGSAIIPGETAALDMLLKAAALANAAAIQRDDAEARVIGDPTEAALLVLAEKAGFGREKLRTSHRRVGEIPFSSVRKFRASLEEAKNPHGGTEKIIYVVGAYETVLERSENMIDDGAERPITEAMRADFDGTNRHMAGRALRVIAVAVKRAAEDADGISDADIAGLTFVGLVGMSDPPRRGVAGAIERCRKAGIRVIMITGDHRETAVAVAREIRLLPMHHEEGAILTGKDVAAMSEKEFAAALKRAVVFARVSPETKFRIVSALEAQGHTVAMTGDGVNDAPALKQASIGVAMGLIGTDVAREAAEMVLADDNFVSIVSAVEEGRVVARNVKLTVAYLFITNLGEAATLLVGLLLGLPLPLLPAQILWLNLVTDGFPDIALATEPPGADMLDEPPKKRHAPIVTKNTWLLGILTSSVMCVGTLALFTRYESLHGLAYAQSVAFTAMAVFQLWNVFSMRSLRESIFRMGFLTNRAVTAAVAASFGLQLIVLYAPFFSSIFKTVPLRLADWLVILAVTSTVFVGAEIYKFLIRRRIVPQSWL